MAENQGNKGIIGLQRLPRRLRYDAPLDFLTISIGIYHQVSFKHLDRYCNEFSYRYNSRNLTDVERFQHVLTHAEGRLKWNELIAPKQ